MTCVTLSTVSMAIAIPLAAQADRATLTGVVTDPSRSVVPGARVKPQAAATGTEYTADTNSAGAYTISSLLVGQYKASAFTSSAVGNGTPARDAVLGLFPARD
jgi:hypothetical protein